MCGPLMVAKIYNESQATQNSAPQSSSAACLSRPFRSRSYQVPTRSAKPMDTIKLSG